MNNNLENVNFQSIIRRDSKPVVFTPIEIEKLRTERILVTGAGGSIGSRIVNVLSSFEGIEYLATDRDEGALHSLSLELDSRALFESPRMCLLDIRDFVGIEKIFDIFKPTTVIHAAALKHLNALQKQPREATLTNVFGTANLVDISLNFGLKKFVNISTDKAADPESVLGYSKYFAELYVAEKRLHGAGGYTSCRFGNVFNSRGSVIETFVHQIISGKPVTLTDPDIERFFMSTEEAAHLTIKSLLLNKGDVHVFDMGQPVLLRSVIENLDRSLGKKSSIVITGLRDGEKKTEKLFSRSEIRIETEEDRISFTNLRDVLNSEKEILKSVAKRDELAVTSVLSGFTSLSETRL